MTGLEAVEDECSLNRHHSECRFVLHIYITLTLKHAKCRASDPLPFSLCFWIFLYIECSEDATDERELLKKTLGLQNELHMLNARLEDMPRSKKKSQELQISRDLHDWTDEDHWYDQYVHAYHWWCWVDDRMNVCVQWLFRSLEEAGPD